MRPWRWAVPTAALACALLAGCSTTVTGAAVPRGPGVVAGRANPTPAPTPTPPPKRTSLSCMGGTVVQPSGAPYCYLLPAGFADATNRLTLNFQTAQPSQYDSAIAVAVHDVILVVTYPLQRDSDGVPAEALAAQVRAVMARGVASGFRVTGDPVPTTVDNDRAFRLSIRQQQGQYTAEVYFVFDGATEVEINCQRAAKQADIDRGCQGVLDSIQVIDPPK
jgi:hypothetical protein